MKLAILTGAIIALFATNSWATTLNTTRSNTFKIEQRGTFVTASTNISGSVSQILYTTPATADFLLTQICTGVATGGTLVQIGGNGIAQVGSGLCQTFTPGMVLSRNQVVTCTTFDLSANTFCTITGLLGPPSLPPLTP